MPGFGAKISKYINLLVVGFLFFSFSFFSSRNGEVVFSYNMDNLSRNNIAEKIVQSSDSGTDFITGENTTYLRVF